MSVFRAAIAVVALSASVALTGCAPVAAVGVGAAAGALAAQEAGPNMSAEDIAIRDQITSVWQETDPDLTSRLSTSVSEGRVLVTGRISNPDQRVDAVRAIWDVPGVVEVMNEVRVGDDEGIAGSARDGWIRAQLRSKMTVDSSIRAINYSVDVVDGVVYLMGVARTSDERDRVVNNARQVPYVSRVVDYINVRDSSETAA